MKTLKSILTLFTYLLIMSFSVNAQEIANKPAHTYTHDHQICGIHEVQAALEAAHPEKLPQNQPGYKSRVQQLNKAIQKAKDTGVNELLKNPNVNYTIPVVFHIIEDCDIVSDNFSNQDAIDALQQLNDDFQGITAGFPSLNNIVPPFNTMVGHFNNELEFILAQKDPNGNPCTGITRVKSPLTDEGYVNAGTSALKDKYHWPTNKYLNIYLVRNAGTSGYSAFPEVSEVFPSNDGIVMSYWAVDKDFSGEAFKHVLAHEVGHWLGLQHIWGGYTYCEDPANCSENDFVFDNGYFATNQNTINLGAALSAITDDTPNTIGNNTFDNYVIDHSINSCADSPEVNDNQQNYMDYTHFGAMFTTKQKEVMTTVLNSPVAGRNNLYSLGNLGHRFYADNYYNSAEPRVLFLEDRMYQNFNGSTDLYYEVPFELKNMEFQGMATLSNQGTSLLGLTATIIQDSPTTGRLRLEGDISSFTQDMKAFLVFNITSFNIPNVDIKNREKFIHIDIMEPGEETLNCEMPVFAEPCETPTTSQFTQTPYENKLRLKATDFVGQNHQFRYRTYGTGAWDSLAITTNLYSWTPNTLDACSLYQYQLRVQCADGTWTGWRNRNAWTRAPRVQDTELTDPDTWCTGAHLYFYGLNGNKKLVRYREVGGSWSGWTALDTNEYYVTYSNLTSGTNYQYDIRVKCGTTGAWSLWKVVNFSTNSCKNGEDASLLNDKAATSSINVYPNPVQNMVNIEMIGTETLEMIQVFDVQGRLVKEVNPTGTKMVVDISDLMEGIYIVQINGQHMQRITKL
mgnify:CR=1 FL=1